MYHGMGPGGVEWAVKRSKVMTNDFEKEVRAAECKLIIMIAANKRRDST